MAQTRHVEMRDCEQLGAIADAFMRYCLEEKKLDSGGCHEGNPVLALDGKQYAAISLPDHSADLIEHLEEWALRERCTIRKL